MFGMQRSPSPSDDSIGELDPRSRLRGLHRQACHDDPEERAGPGYSVRPPETGKPSVFGRIARRWLPESLLNSRVDPGQTGVLAIAMVALVVLLGVAVLAWTSRTSVEPVAAPPLPPPSPAAATAPPELVISVVGEVLRPGLVTVATGARVADAVAAAGGPVPGTDLTGLNLARKLTDGEQLYVAIPAPPQAQSPAEGSGKVDLNTATEQQLDELPGVGEVTAQRIVQWRTEHGRFESVDQLREVGGIGDARLTKLRELVTV